MKTKLSISIYLLMTITFYSLAQKNNPQLYDPFDRVALPLSAPSWMHMIAEDPTGVNFYKMDSLFNDWLAKDVNARVKTLKNKPAVNYYRRWARAYRSFVNNKGQIILPPLEEYYKKIDSLNAQASNHNNLKALTSEKPIWINIGPNKTFTSGKKPKDSQVCVFRLVVSPSDGKTMYAGAETGVIFKSTDKGITWKTPNGSHFFGNHITALAIHPENPNIVFAGSDIALWKSIDGGKNWTRIKGITARVNSIKINKTNPNIVTVATELPDQNTGGIGTGGFYISEDAGRTFILTKEGFCYDHELKPNNPSTIYLLIRPKGERFTSFFISEDNGKSFTENKITPVDRINAGRLGVSDAPNGSEYIYALVTYDAGYNNARGLGQAYILQSKDAGKTWVDKTTRKNKATFRSGATFYDIDDNGGQGYFDMVVQPSNKDPETVIFGLTCLYRSTRGGSGGWADRFTPATGIGGYVAIDKMHPDMQDIIINGDDTWIANDGGIKYSQNFFETDGENRMTGIYASDYHGFDMAWNEDIMAGGRWHNGDVVQAKSYGNGNTIHVGGIEAPTGHIMLNNPYQVYFSDAGTFNMPKTIDGVVNANYNTYFQNIRPFETLRANGQIVFDPRYAMRMILNGQEGYNYNSDRYKLYESKDNGRTMNVILDTDGSFISNYTFARSNPNIIYCSGYINFYRSNDNGKSWDTKTIPFTRNGINSPIMITVSARNANEVWAVDPLQNLGVKYTKDGGISWQVPNLEGLPKDEKFYWLVLANDEKNGIYLASATQGKVYYKDDETKSWKDYSLGLNPGMRITRMMPFFKDAKLRIATNQGVWEAPLVNQNFAPTAQPIALNLGYSKDLTKDTQVQFDSYSIVKQDDKVKWQWIINPKPHSISSSTIRNPIVVFGKEGAYDVTLKVTNARGQSHSRTIHKMIIIGADNGDPNVIAGSASDTPNQGWQYENPNKPTLIDNIEKKDAIVYPNVISKGENTYLNCNHISEDKILTIHNIKGYLLKTYNINLATNKFLIETKDLDSGVYIYELKTKSFKSFGKIIIK